MERAAELAGRTTAEKLECLAAVVHEIARQTAVERDLRRSARVESKRRAGAAYVLRAQFRAVPHRNLDRRRQRPDHGLLRNRADRRARLQTRPRATVWRAGRHA